MTTAAMPALSYQPRTFHAALREVPISRERARIAVLHDRAEAVGGPEAECMQLMARAQAEISRVLDSARR